MDEGIFSRVNPRLRWYFSFAFCPLLESPFNHLDNLFHRYAQLPDVTPRKIQKLSQVAHAAHSVETVATTRKAYREPLNGPDSRKGQPSTVA
jgi:hypothetical protein